MIILLLIAFALYFTGDFSLIDIEKTAIIVALGIDKTGDVYEVTAQVAIPQASDQSTQNDAAIIVGTGDTIFQAVDNIGIQTGWQPKLSFCDLLIFGKSVAQNDVMAIVDHVLASQKLQNSALMAISEGEAKEVLSSATALDTISSFAIQKILLKNTLHVNTVSKANVREFSMMHYSPSNCSYMPLIKIVDEPTKENQNSKSAALQVSSSSSQSGGEEKNVAFDATTTAIFSDGKLACYFDKDETLIYNLLIKDVDESFISVECEGETYLLSITKNKRKRTVSFGEKPIMNV